VAINAKDLLQKLRKNKERFVKSYEALLKAYEKKVIEYQVKYGDYTQKVIRKQLKGEDEREPSAPMRPEDRTKDYDLYIEMLEKHGSLTIELSETLFKRLWKDRWDWTRGYVNLLNAYSGEGFGLEEMALDYSAIVE